MDDFINIVEHNGLPTVSSLEIALKFGKTHKNVLRSIRDICKKIPSDFARRNFEPVNIVRENNVGGNYIDTQYFLTRDAFSLVAMGFTGTEAINWKIRFIKAFNEMETVIVHEMPKLKKRIAELEAMLKTRKKKALSGRSTIVVPVYAETLFGTVELIGTKVEEIDALNAAEKIEAKQIHISKTMEGLANQNKKLTLEAGKERRQNNADVIKLLKN